MSVPQEDRRTVNPLGMVTGSASTTAAVGSTGWAQDSASGEMVVSRDVGKHICARVPR
ncbi:MULTISPECIES: hypothetical protein [Streptomyces]|jgi:hypothetical protein|uniref:hypothetical protein n=1 Tax=Streptomyces TaxID=1883 RepID=UPI0013024622|nr:hypothetical protein [Streptomyces glaucescens]